MIVRFAAMLGLLAGCVTAAYASPWSDAANPSPGSAQSIGKTAEGCLAGGAALPLDGPGFQVIRISRHRYFGHPRTVAFLEALGRDAGRLSLSPFYVGDMSLPRGGPMPNGHASHQTGLDADIWFNLDSKPTLAPAARENVPLPSMVLPGGKEIDPAHFDKRQVQLLRLAANEPNVDRIFVNPAIKRAICLGAAGSGQGDRSWVHRLRPWYGHDDHFHVRLSCPPDSSDCVRQDPVPPGDGCDASLDWWFEPHPAVTPAVPAKPKRAPVLPAACQKLIQP